MKTNERSLERRGVGIGAALAAVALLAGGVGAESSVAGEAYRRQLAERAEMVELGGAGPESLKVHMDKFEIPMEYVAQFHPRPAKQYRGQTVLESFALAQTAVAEVGRVVDTARKQVHAGDKPNQYVVEEADRALAKLADGYNKYLVPAAKNLDRIELRMKAVAGILYVIAPGNGGGGDNGANVEDQKLNQQLQEAQAQRQDEGQGAKAIDRNVVHPKTAAAAVVIEQQARSELGLMRVGVAQLREAQAASREMAGLLGGMDRVLADAQAVQEVLVRNDAGYRAGVKGSAKAADSSEQALQVGVDKVGESTALLTELSGRMRSLVEGGLGNAVESVLRCSEENLSMAKTLQDGTQNFAVKTAAIERALAHNLTAVRSIEAMAPEFHYVLDMKGGKISSVGAIVARSYDLVNAPKVGTSTTVEGQSALRTTVSGGSQLVCEAAGGC